MKYRLTRRGIACLYILVLLTAAVAPLLLSALTGMPDEYAFLIVTSALIAFPMGALFQLWLLVPRYSEEDDEPDYQN